MHRELSNEYIFDIVTNLKSESESLLKYPFRIMANVMTYLQGNYRVELVHREIPVAITGNGYAVLCHL